MQIKYVTNVRIPTTRAHGYAIMKMCSEFAILGNSVELIIPSRVDYADQVPDPFSFYKIEQNFSVKKLFCFDLLGRTIYFGRLFYWLDIASFLFSFILSYQHDESDILYTRDFLMLLGMSKKSNIFLELHDIPHSQFLFKRLLKKPKGFIVITSGIKDALVRIGISEEKILIAPSGVDVLDLNLSITKNEAKEKLKLPLDKKIVMYIGLFDEWKGYSTLLQASNLFPADAQAVLIGGEPEQIDSLKKTYPRAIFLGFRPYSELAINQKAADVLVIPNSGKFPISKYYTSPLKLFAHMASCVPIVATDLPSLREVLNDKNCFFTPPDNPETMAETVNFVLHSLEESLPIADQAFKDVQKYSWNERVNKISEFITETEKI